MRESGLGYLQRGDRDGLNALGSHRSVVDLLAVDVLPAKDLIREAASYAAADLLPLDSHRILRGWKWEVVGYAYHGTSLSSIIPLRTPERVNEKNSIH
jgi:hypothetical protein